MASPYMVPLLASHVGPGEAGRPRSSTVSFQIMEYEKQPRLFQDHDSVSYLRLLALCCGHGLVFFRWHDVVASAVVFVGLTISRDQDQQLR